MQAVGVTAKGALRVLVCTYFTKLVVDKVRCERAGSGEARDEILETILFVANMVLRASSRCHLRKF